MRIVINAKAQNEIIAGQRKHHERVNVRQTAAAPARIDRFARSLRNRSGLLNPPRRGGFARRGRSTGILKMDLSGRAYSSPAWVSEIVSAAALAS